MRHAQLEERKDVKRQQDQALAAVGELSNQVQNVQKEMNQKLNFIMNNMRK